LLVVTGLGKVRTGRREPMRVQGGGAERRETSEDKGGGERTREEQREGTREAKREDEGQGGEGTGHTFSSW
jgi:hypothetical protein